MIEMKYSFLLLNFVLLNADGMSRAAVRHFLHVAFAALLADNLGCPINHFETLAAEGFAGAAADTKVFIN